MVPLDLDECLRRFLAEDLGRGDVTGESLVEPAARAEATVVAKAEGVVAGAELAGRVLRLLDPEAKARAPLPDGERVRPGAAVVQLAGNARAILAAERALLNLLQRMSGIATLTARFVAAVADTGAIVLDTRKTAPGLRFFDKRAVRAGGGANHRMGLWDQVLVKSNHLALLQSGGARAIEAAVRAARARAPAGTRIEVEVLDAEEAVRAAAAGAELVLLDNFAPAAAAQAVRRVRARFSRDAVLLEASGGVRLDNVRAFAEAGVDRISVGALTHSASALDLSLAVGPAPTGGA
jgi:nicotinate-nucleotide pyrophosphorylase (carboxylating)